MLEFRIADSTCIYKKPVKSKATDKKNTLIFRLAHPVRRNLLVTLSNPYNYHQHGLQSIDCYKIDNHFIQSIGLLGPQVKYLPKLTLANVSFFELYNNFTLQQQWVKKKSRQCITMGYNQGWYVNKQTIKPVGFSWIWYRD